VHVHVHVAKGEAIVVRAQRAQRWLAKEMTILS
jgi:hypothetical protein